MSTADRDPNRRDVLAASTAIATIAGLGMDSSFQIAQAQQRPAPGGPPNIVYFLVDNLGYGELGCHGGGVFRGADTRRIDAFANEGMKLLNFTPEAQCTPSRSALMTGRYAIRSGNHTVALSGEEGGLVAWERTMGDILLTVDPKERKAINLPYMHSWTSAHFGRILKEFAVSVKREPLIPAGAPLDHIPVRRT